VAQPENTTGVTLVGGYGPEQQVIDDGIVVERALLGTAVPDGSKEMICDDQWHTISVSDEV
jgi:hypothetical protein